MLNHLALLPYALSLFIGVGLAAAAGFRVFLPMFIVSLASYFHWIPVCQSVGWLATLPALLATGTAMLVEITAYYIPYVDHFLDVLSVPMATIAGSVLFASQFTHLGAFPHWGLALIAGGGTAAAISAGFAGTRAASTATTGGLGNPVVASAETAGAGMMSVLALAAPAIAFIVALILVIAVAVFGRRIWLKFRKKPSAGLS